MEFLYNLIKKQFYNILFNKKNITKMKRPLLHIKNKMNKFPNQKRFKGSEQYWIERYNTDGNSGRGYSSNKDDQHECKLKHIKHKCFTNWIENNIKSWQLIYHIPNIYPFNKSNSSGSFADFYIYQKDFSVLRK